MKLVVSLLIVFTAVVVFATTKEDVKRETREAAETATQYTAEQKAKVQKSMEENIESMRKEIAELNAEAQRKGSAVSANTKEKIREMELKQVELQEDLAKLKTSSGRAWVEIKKGMSSAMQKLSESYEKAKAQF